MLIRGRGSLPLGSSTPILPYIVLRVYDSSFSTHWSALFGIDPKGPDHVKASMSSGRQSVQKMMDELLKDSEKVWISENFKAEWFSIIVFSVLTMTYSVYHVYIYPAALYDVYWRYNHLLVYVTEGGTTGGKDYEKVWISENFKAEWFSIIVFSVLTMTYSVYIPASLYDVYWRYNHLLVYVTEGGTAGGKGLGGSKNLKNKTEVPLSLDLNSCQAGFDMLFFIIMWQEKSL